MTVKLLFFGATADAVGKREIDIVADETHLSSLVKRVAADYPSLASHKLLFAVNQEHAAGDATIHDGDEVAIFTAVSGG